MPAALCSLLVLAGVLRPGPPVHLGGLPPGEPVRVVETPAGLLLGSDAGLYRLGRAGWRLVLTRGGVRDLARGSGETFIATAAGLFVWPDRSEVPRPVGLGAGARVLAVSVSADGRVWVGTEVGLFSRAPREQAFLREIGLPAGAVHGVRAVGDDVFAATRGRLWHRPPGGEFEARLRRLSDGWWELRGAVAAGDTILLAVPRGLWRVGPSDDEATDPGLGELYAIAASDGTGFVASDRGVFPVALDDVNAAPGAGVVNAAAFDVTLAGSRVLVASAAGVEAIPLASGPAVRLSATPVRSPALPELHRAVLAYQGLGPGHMNRVDELAKNAALLPEVRFGFGYDHSRDRETDDDQIISSGAFHELFDRTSSNDHTFDLSLQFTWDLREHREPGRAIAVSRERRELIELRDQVLERVNRLYFERLRVLGQLASVASPERGALELRAREIAAQLDAWTGGRFSRLVETSPRTKGSQP